MNKKEFEQLSDELTSVLNSFPEVKENLKRIAMLKMVDGELTKVYLDELDQYVANNKTIIQ